jgi:hypothetical protein
VALGLGHAVDLFGQRKAGQYQPHALTFLQAETQVLDEMIHEETGGVVASQQTAAQGPHGHTARTAGHHQLQPLLHVQTGFLGKEHGFANTEHDPGDGYLIGQLGLLAAAGITAVQDGLAHDFEAGTHALEGFLVAAHKDGQACFTRTDVTARDRRIQTDAALGGSGFGDAPGQFGAGGHIAEDAAFGQAGQRALFAQHHFFHVTRIAHDGEDDIGIPGHFLRRVGPAGTAGQQPFSAGFGAVVNSQRIAGSQQMPGHGVTHDTGADPAEAQFVVHWLISSVACRDGGVNVTRHSAWAYLPVRACRISCSMALSAGSLPARALWT